MEHLLAPICDSQTLQGPMSPPTCRGMSKGAPEVPEHPYCPSGGIATLAAEFVQAFDGFPHQSAFCVLLRPSSEGAPAP
jgi:hypothetical protein